ncbi:hypothetical protein L2E82_26012 [Cichorium intybus]|uniref:Uncharacterized protein n=1 Tax=Cichorium intybus TaxID=13427 RepID=A0ACB9E562_CICIN|nr:hypothetical protein L2E82_26012 [Cichorium intybus]
MYTSGTTGEPKGVMITNESILSILSGDIKLLIDDLKELKPTVFYVVPCVLDRIYSGLQSFDKVVPSLFHELGLADLVSVYSQLSATGKPPPILDVSDLQQDHEAALRGLCEDLDIPFQDSMLKWEAGPKSVDGIWAPWWYKSVHKSTGFTQLNGNKD